LLHAYLTLYTENCQSTGQLNITETCQYSFYVYRNSCFEVGLWTGSHWEEY